MGKFIGEVTFVGVVEGNVQLFNPVGSGVDLRVTSIQSTEQTSKGVIRVSTVPLSNLNADQPQNFYAGGPLGTGVSSRAEFRYEDGVVPVSGPIIFTLDARFNTVVDGVNEQSPIVIPEGFGIISTNPGAVQTSAKFVFEEVQK